MLYKSLFCIYVVVSCQETKQTDVSLPMELAVACSLSNRQACLETIENTCLEGKLRLTAETDHPSNPKDKRVVMFYDCLKPKRD